MLKTNLRIFVQAALLGLMVFGCASYQAQKETARWQCDQEADAAFAGGDWQAALSGHERLLASQPENGLALYHIGYIMGHLGDRHKEIEFYQRALDCGYRQDDQLFFNLGMALGDLGDVAAGRDALRIAVSLNPDNPDNHFGLGLAEQAGGRTDEARSAFEHAVRLAPEDWEARLALARLLIDLDQWDQAAVQINTVLSTDPANEDALTLRQALENRRALQYK